MAWVPPLGLAELLFVVMVVRKSRILVKVLSTVAWPSANRLELALTTECSVFTNPMSALSPARG